MTLLRTTENPANGFNLYFLGYPDKQTTDKSLTADKEGILELTWNYGTEEDTNFSYHNGNEEPQGFGHICELGSCTRTRRKKTCVCFFFTHIRKNDYRKAMR